MYANKILLLVLLLLFSSLFIYAFGDKKETTLWKEFAEKINSQENQEEIIYFPDLNSADQQEAGIVANFAGYDPMIASYGFCLKYDVTLPNCLSIVEWDAGIVKGGETLYFRTNASDSPRDDPPDNLKLFVCKNSTLPAFSDSACVGADSTWCVSDEVSGVIDTDIDPSNGGDPTCSFTAPSNNAVYQWWTFLIDSSGSHTTSPIPFPQTDYFSSNVYSSDATPPTIITESLAGITNPAYYDATQNVPGSCSTTLKLGVSESMNCRWSETSQSYSAMPDDPEHNCAAVGTDDLRGAWRFETSKLKEPNFVGSEFNFPAIKYGSVSSNISLQKVGDAAASFAGGLISADSYYIVSEGVLDMHASTAEGNWDSGGSYTLMGWVNFRDLTSPVDAPVIVGKRYSISNSAWNGLRLDPSTFQFVMIVRRNDDPAPHLLVKSTTISTIDTWYHVTGVVDLGSSPKKIRIYVNGQPEASADIPGGWINLGGNGDIWIGLRDVGQVGQTNGLIDEVKVWQRALTDQEILDIYNDEDDGVIDSYITPLKYNEASCEFSWESGGVCNGITTEGSYVRYFACIDRTGVNEGNTQNVASNSISFTANWTPPIISCSDCPTTGTNSPSPAFTISATEAESGMTGADGVCRISVDDDAYSSMTTDCTFVSGNTWRCSIPGSAACDVPESYSIACVDNEGYYNNETDNLDTPPYTNNCPPVINNLLITKTSASSQCSENAFNVSSNIPFTLIPGVDSLCVVLDVADASGNDDIDLADSKVLVFAGPDGDPLEAEADISNGWDRHKINNFVECDGSGSPKLSLSPSETKLCAQLTPTSDLTSSDGISVKDTSGASWTVKAFIEDAVSSQTDSFVSGLMDSQTTIGIGTNTSGCSFSGSPDQDLELDCGGATEQEEIIITHEGNINLDAAVQMTSVLTHGELPFDNIDGGSLYWSPTVVNPVVLPAGTDLSSQSSIVNLWNRGASDIANTDDTYLYIALPPDLLSGSYDGGQITYSVSASP